MPSKIEYEFGVPFPGRVVPGNQWTRTGYRDHGSSFDWDCIFGRSSRRIVDLGCGNGRYLIGSALTRPDCDHLGIDLVQRAIDFAAHRANKRGLLNVRFITADATLWLFQRLVEDSIDEIHVYHPQPYYEMAEISQRMLTPDFLERTWRVLRANGILVLQTDNKAYWNYLHEAVSCHFEPEIVPGRWPDAPQGRTRREILAHSKGLAIWRMIARRREKPSKANTSRIDFDANRPRFKRGR